MRFAPNRDQVLTGLFFLSLMILAMIQVEDTDAWLHLSLGRELVHLRSLPATEPFTFPSLDQPFLYTSWLFGVLLYGVYSIFGFPGLVLLKVAAVALGIGILFLDSLKPVRNYALSTLVLSVYVIQFRYRFVERPDILLVVFLAFTVYALNIYIAEGKRILYALPLVHLLWANSHSSIVLMPVPFMAVLAGGLLQQWLLKKGLSSRAAPAGEQLKTIFVIFLLSLASTLLNPNGAVQFTYGQSLMSTAWYKEMITELNPLTPRQTGEMAAGIILTFVSFYANRRKFSLTHLFLVLPFMILPFSAQRFHFLFSVIASPVVIRNFAVAFEDAERPPRPLRGPIATAGILVWIVVYTGLGLAHIPPFGYPNKKFGLDMNPDMTPAGAVAYMDARGINGRIFTVFPWGSYLIWTGSPDRTVFVDARGYLSEFLLNAMTLAATGDREIMDYLARTYGFETVLLDYPTRDLSDKREKLLPPETWALVHWDDTSLLYVKRGGRYETFISADEYRVARPLAGKSGVIGSLNAGAQDELELELNRNVRMTSSLQGLMLLGHLYNNTGRRAEAVDTFTRVTAGASAARYLPAAYNGLGDAYYALRQLEKSLANYQTADALIEHKDAGILFKMADIHISRGESAKAVDCLSTAIKADNRNLQAHERLIRLYEQLGQHENAAEAVNRYEDVKRDVFPSNR